MKLRLIAFALAFAFVAGAVAQVPATPPREVKNVIFLLTDGTGPEAWPLARWIKGVPLALDAILTGAIRTYGADSIITDSAPGATAFATGFKGTDKGIAVGAWNVTIDAAKDKVSAAHVPLASLLEGARLSGRAVGIVATSNVQHATPAAFSSHWFDRNNFNEISEQQVYQGIDVMLGGGAQYLVSKDAPGGKREDKENLVDVIKAKGYRYVTTKDELAAVTSGKVWGAFAPDAMAYDIDRDEIGPNEPSLADMTNKAIALLSGAAKGRGKGFFLFVEGSKVDWAAHANDPAGLVSDLLAFDAAAKAALDFAKKDGNTLVVVVSDHGTGGVTIGLREDAKYSQTDDDSLVVPMRKTQATAETIEKLIAGDASEEKIKSVLGEKWGIVDVSPTELAAIQDTLKNKKPLSPVIVPMLSVRARIGWTTGGHTGADVFLFAYGPVRPAGLMENTELGRYLAASLGFDFAALNARLFVAADAVFPALGCTIAVDRADSANPVLVVTKGERKAMLPFSKNLLVLGAKTVELEGLVVYAEKLDKVYVPRQAVDLVKAEFK